MTGARHRRRMVTAGMLAVALLATACGRDEPAAPAAASTASTSPVSSLPGLVTAPVVPTTAAPSAVTSPEEVPPPPPGTSGAAGLVVPAETAGELDARSVPEAPALGPGWQRYVDPGDVAEGYSGNGSWVRARGAAEVVQAVVPLGCLGLTEAPDLPVPRDALEATYRGPGGAPAVALVLDYDSERQASRFLAGMATIARSCPAPDARVRANDPLTAVVEPVRVGPRTVLDRRRGYGVGADPWLWSEVVVQQGDRVGLLVVASRPDAEAPDLVVLADRLRAAVPR